MIITDICIYFVIAILSVAYPILLQVATRLDEKYSSLIIISLFKKEWEWDWFRITIASCLILILLYIISGLEFLPIGLFKKTLRDFSSYWLIASTFLLIISFLAFVRKILIYYNPQDLINYFDQKEETKDYVYFRALADILYVTIRMQDIAIAQILARHFYRYFKSYREKFVDEPVTYPNEYYYMVYQTVVELIPFKSKKLALLGDRTVGCVWFIGEGDLKPISENTYNWIWNNLQLSVENERDDFVMNHWSHNHQTFDNRYFNVHAKPIIVNREIVITNQEEINRINKERKQFLELQYALGGLLLYSERYHCIRRMFDFTMSEPPQYVLLPRDMSIIFEQFMQFWDPWEQNFPMMLRYHFPGMEGIQAEGKAKNWICQYVAILFIRQYQLISRMYGYDPMAFPRAPTQQEKKQLWIEHLPRFKSFIADVRNNAKLLKVLRLDNITDDWCIQNHKLPPNEYIDEVIRQMSQTI